MICCVRRKPRQSAGGRAVIKMRRAQFSFGDGLIAEEVSDLRESWMTHADQVLADEQIVAAVYEALMKRHPKSRSRGRLGAPAEVVLRLLILKHIRNWSYGVLEREVRANLVYRDFTRVGAAKTPDAKTMGRWGVAVGPDVVKQIHERLVRLARDKGAMEGRRMRVDTTVVETNIHYPTDSSLLGDGGADPHHEEGLNDRWQGWSQTARPQSDGEATGAGHRARGALQSQAEPGEAHAGVRQIAQLDQPGGRTGEAVLQRDHRRGEARFEHSQAVGAGGPGSGTRCDGATHQAGDEADQSAHLPRRYARGRQDLQPVRAVDRNHPQGQGGQAQRVRQDGETAGGRKPDCDRL